MLSVCLQFMAAADMQTMTAAAIQAAAAAN